MCVLCVLVVSIVVGLTMFKHLPRHTFGLIQSKLFPKYFLIGTILSSVAMVTFITDHPMNRWDSKETIQVYNICIVCITNIIIMYTILNVLVVLLMFM